jgi:hypothetical protein
MVDDIDITNSYDILITVNCCKFVILRLSQASGFSSNEDSGHDHGLLGCDIM